MLDLDQKIEETEFLQINTMTGKVRLYYIKPYIKPQREKQVRQRCFHSPVYWSLAATASA